MVFQLLGELAPRWQCGRGLPVSAASPHLLEGTLPPPSCWRGDSLTRTLSCLLPPQNLPQFPSYGERLPHSDVAWVPLAHWGERDPPHVRWMLLIASV